MSTRKAKILRIVAALGIVVALVHCTISPLQTAGGASGTEVSIVTGMVVDRNGLPAGGAVVRLRPDDFLVDSAASPSYCQTHSILNTVTGTDGSFAFDTIVPDSYSVEIVCADSSGAFTAFRLEPEPRPVRLPALRALPLARLSGNMQISYNVNAYGIIQVYGLDRTVSPDSFGNFALMVPHGNHKIHIGAYTRDSARHVEFDGMDLSCNVGWGEDKNIGSYYMKPPPPPPCLDGSCDSAVVRRVLDMMGMQQVRTYEVTKAENGRIVELNLRGRPLPNGIPPDINRLVELRVLDLGQTGLKVMFPDMGRMTKLEIIRFDGDHIQMFSSGIGNCTALKELDLYGNELTELPQSILNLNALTYFNIGNNRLCQVDSAMAMWIDRYDPVWRTNQRCQ